MQIIKKAIKNYYNNWSKYGEKSVKIPPFFFVRSLQIELSSECNFKGNGGYCPMCSPMLTGERKKETMDQILFKNIVDSLPKTTKWLRFVGHGEPTSHPYVWHLIKYARSKDFRCFITSNGLSLTKEKIAEIEEANPDVLELDLDGLDEKTHKSYRRGSNYSRLINAIESLSSLKRQGRINTKLVAQTIVLKQNEDQIDQIRNYVHNLGFEHKATLASFGNRRLKNRNYLIKKYAPENDVFLRSTERSGEEALFTNAGNKRFVVDCPWMFSCMVLADGTVVKCCYDFSATDLVIGELNNANSLKDIWYSDRHYQVMREIASRQKEICFASSCGRSIIPRVHGK